MYKFTLDIGASKMADMDCANVFSEYFPFWKELDVKEQEQLCRNSQLVKYSKGQNVHGGNICTGMIIVRSGCLRAYMLSEEGREITLYRLRPGEICMLSASCVLQTITFDVFVDAEEDSQCYLINGPFFKALSERNLLVKNYALETAVGRFSDVMWIMQEILFMSMDRRVAKFLLEEAGADDTVRLTHEQIARYMGTAREVISRMVKYFAAEGMVISSRGLIRISDREKLQRLAE